MSILSGSKKVPNHYVPIDANNINTKDWLILLEAGTIVGAAPSKLRVARSTQDRKVVKQWSLFGETKYYLDVADYDPRVHAVYFCPQLYKVDQDKKLAPLHGDEIGALIARVLEKGVKERRPWYHPSEGLPGEAVINIATLEEFDTLVVDMPPSLVPSARSEAA